MTIEEQLKQKILERYKSIRSFTQAIDIPYTTLDSIFKRGLSNAGVGTVIKIFTSLDLDVESIVSCSLEEKMTECCITVDKRLSDAISQLNEEGCERVVEYAEDLVAGGRYKKHGQDAMVKEA